MANWDTYTLRTALSLLDTFLFDDVSQAADEDRISRMTIQTLIAFMLGADNPNQEALSATKELADTDVVIQELDPNGADRVVELPPEAGTNKPHVIYNSGSANTLTVKDDSGTTTFGSALAAGELSIFFPVDGTWAALSGGGGGGGADLSEIYAMNG